MTAVVIDRNQPGCITQALWFLLVGWWATALWVSLAWALCALIITLPLGVMMLNNVPKVLALRNPGGNLRVRVLSANGKLVDVNEQHSFLLRAVWFLLIGWWWSAIVIVTAYAFALTIIGLPVAFWMFDRVPGAVTLRK